MKFVNSIPFGRFGPRGFCRDEGPYDPLYARGAAPREQVVRLGFCSPPSGGAPPLHPGGFCRDGSPRSSNAGAPREHGFAMLGTRVTFVSRRKSPKACQNLRFWTPSVRGYRPFRARCASRRAGFCHRKRPICHFEFVGKPVFISPLVSAGKIFCC